MDIIAFITGLVLLLVGRNLLQALYYKVEGLKSSGKDYSRQDKLLTILINIYATTVVGYFALFIGIAIFKVLEYL
jgi:hypothetical protein